MFIFAGARKCDFKILAEELGETVNDSHKLNDLKKIILASKEYDEESAKEWMNTIINERKEREENEIRQQETAERRRQDEIQIAEQKMQLEYEERKRKDEMEFKLQKIRLEAEGWSLNSNSIANQNVNSMQIKPYLEIHHLMQKFNSDENDISLYLIMFERLAKQAEILGNSFAWLIAV
ncbi:hypothetical protein AVEN_130089-1 [Araneus ventricosus]|uniref:Uncharacterized protein n=1 Tax=Araneus ventricosus TaxID=182803 RepID=A0A4Y2EL60_ARAVE|nr:hypothetical protein AVEN_130089-1 [Araneus ventricosus]